MVTPGATHMSGNKTELKRDSRLFCALNLPWIPTATQCRCRSQMEQTPVSYKCREMRTHSHMQMKGREGAAASSEKKRGCPGQGGLGKGTDCGSAAAPQRPANVSLRPAVAAGPQPTKPCQGVRSQPQGASRTSRSPLPSPPGSQCHQEKAASLQELFSFWLKCAPSVFR